MEITNEMREFAIDKLNEISDIARKKMSDGVGKEEIIFSIEMGKHALLLEQKAALEKEMETNVDFIRFMEERGLG